MINVFWRAFWLRGGGQSGVTSSEAGRGLRELRGGGGLGRGEGRGVKGVGI